MRSAFQIVPKNRLFSLGGTLKISQKKQKCLRLKISRKKLMSEVENFAKKLPGRFFFQMQISYRSKPGTCPLFFFFFFWWNIWVHHSFSKILTKFVCKSYLKRQKSWCATKNTVRKLVVDKMYEIYLLIFPDKKNPLFQSFFSFFSPFINLTI